MKHSPVTMRRTLATLFCAAMGLAHAADPQDWAGLHHFQADNAALAPAARQTRRVVFMGDSITEGWSNSRASVFTSPARINRGISGQTTPQMVLRFRQDVIALRPRAVVILAGTNDIAGNTGPATLEEIEGNIASMAELARAHNLPFIVFRAIADTAQDDLPEAALVGLNEEGRPAIGAVLRSLLKRPWQLPALIRVALRSRAALAALLGGRAALL